MEARVDARLLQFTRHPKLKELKKLIPVDNWDNNILLVKATYFECGGVAVGVCLSHKAGDASSFVSFMNAWAATCREEVSRIIHPSFDLALHFPPGNLCSTTAGITREKMVRRRIVFEREKLEKVKREVATSSDEVKDPTIPNHTFGNCMMLTSAVVSGKEDERERGVRVPLHVSKLRAAIRAMC